MSGVYAKQTTVSPENSRAELEKTVRKYGASAYAYGFDGDRASVQFVMSGRHIRLDVKVPVRAEFHFTRQRVRRTPSQVENARDAEERRLWRCLVLLVKGKLEAIESGITGFDDEFMAHMLLPDGSTVAESVKPGIELAYETGEQPKLLGS